jgi:hypothetical protein
LFADSIVSQGRGAMAREFRSASPYMRFGRIRPNLQQDYATPSHNFSIHPPKTADQARLRADDLRFHFFARLCTA